MSDIKTPITETHSIGPPGSLAPSVSAQSLSAPAQSIAQNAQPTDQETIDPTQYLQLTTQDQEQIATLAARINLRDSVATACYGGHAQTRLRSYTEDVLEHVVRTDADLISNTLATMSTRIRSFSQLIPSTPSPLRPFRWTKRLQAQYDATLSDLKHDQKILDGRRMSLLVDLGYLDEAYQQILEHYKALVICIEAGRQKLAATRTGELAALEQTAQRTGAQEDVIAHTDLQLRCNNFEKHLSNLDLTKTIFLQSAVQVQLVRQANQALVDNLQSTLSTAVATWQQNIAATLSAHVDYRQLQSSNQQLFHAVTQAVSLQEHCEHQRADADALRCQVMHFNK